MRDRILILASALLSMIAISFPAVAKDSLEQNHSQISCNSYQAEYAPSSDFKSGTPALNFKLSIHEENPKKNSMKEQVLFILDTYENEGEKRHLSTFRIPYVCSGGSIPSCALRPIEPEKGTPPVQLHITALNQDFSRADLLDGNAPYALILSDAASVFYKLPWDKINTDRMIYHVGSKDDDFNQYHRPFIVPSVWIFNSCDTPSKQR